MIVYVLSFIACLGGAPDRCQVVRLEVNGCSVAGMAAAAQWQGQHPEWTVVAIGKCEMGREI